MGRKDGKEKNKEIEENKSIQEEETKLIQEELEEDEKEELEEDETQVLDIIFNTRNAMLQYCTENVIPLCENLTIIDFLKFIEKI